MSKIKKIGFDAWERADSLDTWVCIVFWSCLDLCLNFFIFIQVWEGLVLILVKEKLAGQELDDWLVDGKIFFQN